MTITPEMLRCDNLDRTTTLAELIELPHMVAVYKKALWEIWRGSRQGSKARKLAAKALGLAQGK